MTYCVALYLQTGLVMLSDTRTNAGVDHISTFSKMHVFEQPGERAMALLTAGNLAVSQAVVNLLREGVEDEGEVHTLLTVPRMFRAARLVGTAIQQVYRVSGPSMEAQKVGFDVAVLLGGQIRGRPHRLFHVYSAGNYIEATPDTPFLQVGEHKYGKPILDRACTHDTELYDGVKLVLISMDSTLRSNLTVGLPIDLLVYRVDTHRFDLHRRIDEQDDYFRRIRERWSAALRKAYRAVPRPPWLTEPPTG